jgi:hypothetical protein
LLTATSLGGLGGAGEEGVDGGLEPGGEADGRGGWLGDRIGLAQGAVVGAVADDHHGTELFGAKARGDVFQATQQAGGVAVGGEGAQVGQGAGLVGEGVEVDLVVAPPALDDRGFAGQQGLDVVEAGAVGAGQGHAARGVDEHGDVVAHPGDVSSRTPGCRKMTASRATAPMRRARRIHLRRPVSSRVPCQVRASTATTSSSTPARVQGLQSESSTQWAALNSSLSRKKSSIGYCCTRQRRRRRMAVVWTWSRL